MLPFDWPPWWQEPRWTSSSHKSSKTTQVVSVMDTPIGPSPLLSVLKCMAHLPYRISTWNLWYVVSITYLYSMPAPLSQVKDPIPTIHQTLSSKAQLIVLYPSRLSVQFHLCGPIDQAWTCIVLYQAHLSMILFWDNLFKHSIKPTVNLSVEQMGHTETGDEWTDKWLPLTKSIYEKKSGRNYYYFKHAETNVLLGKHCTTKETNKSSRNQMQIYVAWQHILNKKDLWYRTGLFW